MPHWLSIPLHLGHLPFYSAATSRNVLARASFFGAQAVLNSALTFCIPCVKLRKTRQRSILFFIIPCINCGTHQTLHHSIRNLSLRRLTRRCIPVLPSQRPSPSVPRSHSENLVQTQLFHEIICFLLHFVYLVGQRCHRQAPWPIYFLAVSKTSFRTNVAVAVFNFLSNFNLVLFSPSILPHYPVPISLPNSAGPSTLQWL